MPWQQFAALSVAANFREQWLRKLKQLEQRQHEQQQQQQHFAAVPDSAPCQPKTAKKGQTSLQLFRRDWMKQHTVLGERKNFVTKESWAAVREDFSALSDARRKSYEDESDASKAVAAITRRQRNTRHGMQPETPQIPDLVVVPSAVAGDGAIDNDNDNELPLRLKDLRFSSLALPSAIGAVQNVKDYVDYVPEETPVSPDVLHSYYNGSHLSNRGSAAPWRPKRSGGSAAQRSQAGVTIVNLAVLRSAGSSSACNQSLSSPLSNLEANIEHCVFQCIALLKDLNHRCQVADASRRRWTTPAHAERCAGRQHRRVHLRCRPGCS